MAGPRGLYQTRVGEWLLVSVWVHSFMGKETADCRSSRFVLRWSLYVRNNPSNGSISENIPCSLLVMLRAVLYWCEPFLILFRSLVSRLHISILEFCFDAVCKFWCVVDVMALSASSNPRRPPLIDEHFVEWRYWGCPLWMTLCCLSVTIHMKVCCSYEDVQCIPMYKVLILLADVWWLLSVVMFCVAGLICSVGNFVVVW